MEYMIAIQRITSCERWEMDLEMFLIRGVGAKKGCPNASSILVSVAFRTNGERAPTRRHCKCSHRAYEKSGRESERVFCAFQGDQQRVHLYTLETRASREMPGVRKSEIAVGFVDRDACSEKPVRMIPD